MWPFNNKIDFYIVLRQSPDWKNMTQEEFRQQSIAFCRCIGRPENLINDIAVLWGNTFGISFLETRQAIKDIAQKNFYSIKKSKVLLLDDLIEKEYDFSRGIYLFIDDDDWVKPNIIDHLPQKKDIYNYDGFRWGSIMLNGNKKEEDNVITYRAFDTTCFTNNYIVSSRYLNSNTFDSVFQHWAATDTFLNLNIKQLPEYLSITNKHPASTLCLEQNLVDDFSSSRLIEIINIFNTRINSIDLDSLGELSWAAPYIKETQVFYKQLLASRLL